MPAGHGPAGEAQGGDIKALAKGGRTNFFGFVLRLAARLPFLFIAGRMYGADQLGRFAYAILVVELCAQFATLGLKRGLAHHMSQSETSGRLPAHLVFDAVILSLIASTFFSVILLIFPQLMFPNSEYGRTDHMLALIVPAVALTEIALAALAYRYDIASTVRAKSVVEPWTISIAAGVFYFIVPGIGLILSYVVSMVAALVTALIPLAKSYGRPRGWRAPPRDLWQLARRNFPLAAADAVEWGSRRLDLAILGLFAAPAIVGVYYVAQQVASLPQKLKTSFDPILGPVITRNLKEGRMKEIARQVGQVGFWIIAMQAGIALALGIPGEAVMGLVGPNFVGGTGALAFLLVAEVVAATAVVSEAALVYIARHRNLMISLSMLALQGALSVAFLVMMQARGWSPLFQAAAVAMALTISLGLSSLLKARLLTKLLGAPVNGWRWTMIWAAAAAIVVGWAFTWTPEWVELALGIPSILGVFGAIIWRFAFNHNDRELFRVRQGDKAVPQKS